LEDLENYHIKSKNKLDYINAVIVKNKNGKTGNFDLFLLGKYMTIVEDFKNLD
jgi:hypothetical protein